MHELTSDTDLFAEAREQPVAPLASGERIVHRRLLGKTDEARVTRPRETDAIYQALVEELSGTVVPTSIMGVTVVGVGLYVATALHDPVLLAAAGIGGAATLAKLGLIAFQRRHAGEGVLPRDRIRRWEAGHALATFAVAGSVGVQCGAIFIQPVMAMQLLATALLFGYCSGVVTRLSVRPPIAVTALLIATAPAIAATLWVGEAPHLILGAIFAMFLFGALNGVNFSYRSTLRHIRLHRDMAALAHQDSLTGLANRLGLREAFHRISGAGSGGIAVHCLDLDGFKPINDRFGHAMGDALLRALGLRLRALQPDGVDLAARVGGDEFVVLQPALDIGQAELFAQRVLAALSQPYAIAGETIRVGISLGYAWAPTPSADLDRLQRRADEASYSVKRQGGGVASPRQIPRFRAQRAKPHAA